MGTFRTRLTVTVIPVVLLGLAATVVMGVTTATRAQRASSTAASTQLAAGTAGDIGTMARTMQQTAVTIAAIAEGMAGTDRALLSGQIRSVAGRTPGLVDSYVAYEAGRAPGRDADWAGKPGNTERGRMATVWLRGEGRDPNASPGTVRTELFPYSDKVFAAVEQLDWYHGPKTTGQVTTAEPYIDGGTKLLMTSFTAPIRSPSGRFDGVGGVDVPLDAISRQIAATRIGRSGYAILVSAKGVVLGAPPASGGAQSIIGHKRLVDVVPAARREQIGAALTGADRAPGTLAGADPFSGRPGLLSWARVPSTGWTVLTVRPMKEINAPVAQLRSTLIVAGLLVALAVIGIVAFAAHRLTRPLPLLRSAALRLARGELDATLPPASNDEMGEVSMAFASMAEYLRSAAGHARGIAGGDLQTVIAPASQDDVLGQALETMRADLAVTVRTLVGNAGALNISAENLRIQAEALRARASETSAQSRTAAHGTAEFDRALVRIAESTSNSARMASEVAGAAAFMNEQLDQLSQSSEAIEEVLSVITAIADQTQLLALNATIESARAGEVGKGFAVVADEVKQLANSTTSATVRVSGRVTAIQEAVATTVESIGIITERVAGMSELGRSIGVAVEQQAISSARVGRSAEEVARAAERTDHDVTGTIAVSKDVASAARQLQDIVERFRL